MTTKQLAYCAVHGRKVTFTYLREKSHVYTGYVVGGDDFKVMLAVPNNDEVDVVLLHKTAEIIKMHSEPTLSSELPAVRLVIENIGRSFWTKCNRQFFNDGSADEDPESPRAAVGASNGRPQRGRSTPRPNRQGAFAS